MRTLIALFILSAIPAFCQCGRQVVNPGTGKLDCIGNGSVGPTGPTGPTGSTGAAGAAGQSTVSFLVCAAPCVVGDASNWKWTVPAARTVTSCTVDATIYPTGAAVTVNILKNATFAGYGVLPQWTGGTTIFTSTLPTLSAGGTTFNTQSGMAAAAVLTTGDYLVASVTAVGSTIPGQGVNIVCAVQ